MSSPEIPDALPADFPEAPAPYRNLWVPLIVIPAMIVMVLVLVWVLFGSLAGSEKSPAENVQRMVEGSSNEREQASILLVNQIEGYLEDLKAGREPEWELDASFLPDVQRALEKTEPDEVEFRYVLSFVQLQLGDPEGLDNLIALLSASDGDDPGATMRFYVLWALGALGPVLDPAQRAASQTAVLPFLESEDSGLRLMAAAALQGLPGEGTGPALQRALGDRVLSVRGTAALSLAHLGDPAGAEVLKELLDAGSYAAERAVSPDRWAHAERVSETRIQAVRALARLGRPEDLAALEPVARDDADPNVRAVALRALADAED